MRLQHIIIGLAIFTLTLAWLFWFFPMAKQGANQPLPSMDQPTTERRP